MSDVSFNEEQDIVRYASASAPRRGGVIGLVIRMGLAKTEAQANGVLITIAAVAFIASLFILFESFSSPKPSAEDVRLQTWMSQGHTGMPPADFKP